MIATTQQRRQYLWERAERMRIGLMTVRQSREALHLIRVEAARRLPAEALEWFDPGDYLICERPDVPALPVRVPRAPDARFTTVGRPTQ
ncbi:hypothetical protein [Streptacidiphilus sp. MAP12-33]|uniref:hypothetical protein n=1 Tax=Streptacidiphilus sp. MAP12-33 TaxID=3156266 RepID=UPI0035139BE8